MVILQFYRAILSHKYNNGVNFICTYYQSKQFVQNFVIKNFSNGVKIYPYIHKNEAKSKMPPADILKQVRNLMKNEKYVKEPLQAYIVPWADAHNSEYLAECDTQRAILSGFTGSAGTAIVTDEQALLWTDGRYYLQASKQLDKNWTLMKESLPETPSQGVWLSKNLPKNSRVGVDPTVITDNAWRSLSNDLDTNGVKLVAVDVNLVNIAWEDKPNRPKNPVILLPQEFSGKSCAEKLKSVRAQMLDNGACALVVTALDEVAYILNLRGTDIQFNPVFFAYLIITQNEAHLFIDDEKLPENVKEYLSQPELSLKIHPYGSVRKFLSDLGTNSGKIWFGTTANYSLTSAISGKSLLIRPSPIALMKAIKNATEISGIGKAHVRDAAALCRYFAWLEKEILSGNKVTEISGATKLEEFRSELENYAGLSFDTISSVGPNGAIIHYHPTPETDLTITSDMLYLCDSGAQYKDGTTDVTRTLHFGTPTDRQKECFTRVLKGQLQMGSAIFPDKIRGNCLDTLARKFLWDVGLDYQHGTGHGIGSHLCVHEGPMGISWRTYPDDPGLTSGMFLSNEPGYYEPGEFGIRLENIVQVVPSKRPNFLTFETITLVPIQAKMIQLNLLTSEEINLLNAYHRQCREEVGALLIKLGHTEANEWLIRETKPL